MVEDCETDCPVKRIVRVSQLLGLHLLYSTSSGRADVFEKRLRPAHSLRANIERAQLGAGKGQVLADPALSAPVLEHGFSERVSNHREHPLIDGEGWIDRVVS